MDSISMKNEHRPKKKRRWKKHIQIEEHEEELRSLMPMNNFGLKCAHSPWFIWYAVACTFRLISLFFGPFAMPQCERHCFIRLPQNAYKLLSVMLVIILNLCMHSLMNECICACFNCYLAALATVGVIFQTSSPTIWHSPVKYDRDAQRRRRRPRLIQLLYFNELTNQGWLFTFLSLSWIKMQRHPVYKIKFEPFWLDLNLKLAENSKITTKRNKNEEQK